MSELLIKAFVKNNKETQNPKVRENYASLSSYVGIAVNIILSSSKIICGLLFGALSVLADGINNLSDMLNSIILLIGFRLSGRPADKEHPFGHGRFEYIAGLAISFFIMLLGLSLVKSSIEKIFSPEPMEVSFLILAVLCFSILLKGWLFVFYRKIAKRIDSVAVMANAKDSISDVVATSFVLIGILITKYLNINVDGYLGLMVAGFIIWCAITLIRDTVTPLLGEAPEEKLSSEIEEEIKKNKSVIGIHDLMIHSYGAGKTFATVHAEVDARTNILKCHDDIDNIEKAVERKFGVALVIHMDPVVTDDPEVNELKALVKAALLEISPSLSIHDFRAVLGETHHNLVFDLVIPYDFDDDDSHLVERIKAKVNKMHPGKEKLYLIVNMDRKYN